MAHETGSATDPIDLLDKLRLFCIAQGLTVNEFRNEGVAPGKLLSVSFNGGFFSIGFVVNATTGFEGYVLTQASGFNASTAWGSQPNETSPTTSQKVVCFGILNGAAISDYHFAFFTGGVVMVSLNTVAGSWRHFCFGDIEKYGTYTGGAIILGHFIEFNAGLDNPFSADNVPFGYMPSSIATQQRGGFVRVDDISGIKFRKMATTGLVSASIRMSSNQTILEASRNRIHNTSPSTPTQASSLHPIAFAVPIADGSAKFSPIGVLRDVRFCNIQLLDNEQVFDTDWLAFSQGVKNNPDARPGTENTGFLGITVKVL
ncbi:MAG: hypothetical protein JKX78_02790 [Alteromonadaceae bacterium]|nr:hypothetical protein [Alteromonadaceae bacterium]